MATFTVTTSTKPSGAPTTVGDRKIVLDHGGTHIFTIANLTTETTPPYVDPENDAISKFKILSATYANGAINLSGVPVTIGQEIDHTDITSGLLTYNDDSANALDHESLLTFTLSDLGSNTFSSSIGNIKMAVLAEANLAPTEVGDASENIGYGESLVFTRAMFTTDTTPAYADPEGDVADLLKITALPTSGIIKLNGIIVTVNQEINFTDIDSSLLVFTGDVTLLAGGSDTFTFEIADVGSGIFVS
mgnify:CR=1 FL=1|tara:strand:- start:2818 stop:3558 length:741 start_codon:yes stop_codon:yes gene_type:complete